MVKICDICGFFFTEMIQSFVMCRIHFTADNSCNLKNHLDWTLFVGPIKLSLGSSYDSNWDTFRYLAVVEGRFTVLPQIPFVNTSATLKIFAKVSTPTFYYQPPSLKSQGRSLQF